MMRIKITDFFFFVHPLQAAVRYFHYYKCCIDSIHKTFTAVIFVYIIFCSVFSVLLFCFVDALSFCAILLKPRCFRNAKILTSVSFSCVHVFRHLKQSAEFVLWNIMFLSLERKRLTTLNTHGFQFWASSHYMCVYPQQEIRKAFDLVALIC